MKSRCVALVAFLATAPAVAFASAQVALDQNSRSAQTLTERAAERETLLRKRIAILYQMSRGGMARWLIESRDSSDFALRAESARRIVQRDVEEIAAMQRERDDVERTRAELVTRLARLETARGKTSPLDSRRGLLPFPVRGATLKSALGGLSARTAAKAPVRAVGAGRVLHVGPISGFDNIVLVDHGGSLVSLYAQLGETNVRAEQPIVEGTIVGHVADRTFYFELRRNAEVLPPTPWFRR